MTFAVCVYIWMLHCRCRSLSMPGTKIVGWIGLCVWEKENGSLTASGPNYAFWIGFAILLTGLFWLLDCTDSTCPKTGTFETVAFAHGGRDWKQNPVRDPVALLFNCLFFIIFLFLFLLIFWGMWSLMALNYLMDCRLYPRLQNSATEIGSSNSGCEISNQSC